MHRVFLSQFVLWLVVPAFSSPGCRSSWRAMVSFRSGWHSWCTRGPAAALVRGGHNCCTNLLASVRSMNVTVEFVPTVKGGHFD